jgi:hypothetical protein
MKHIKFKVTNLRTLETKKSVLVLPLVEGAPIREIVEEVSRPLLSLDHGGVEEILYPDISYVCPQGTFLL